MGSVCNSFATRVRRRALLTLALVRLQILIDPRQRHDTFVAIPQYHLRTFPPVVHADRMVRLLVREPPVRNLKGNFKKLNV